MARRLKPKVDPVLLAAQQRAEAKKPENWGVNVDALGGQADVTLLHGAKGRVQAAHRADVFDRMHSRRALSEAAHQAIRRLDGDMTERRGDGARGTSPTPGGGFGSRDLVTVRSLDAGRRVEAVLLLVGRRDAALLSEMLEPRKVLVGEGVDRWRLVVAALTGEQHAHAQGAVVRSASENLALAYRDIDGATRRAS